MERVTQQDFAPRVVELTNKALNEIDISEINNSDFANTVRDILTLASSKVGISPSEVDASLNAPAIIDRINQIIQAVENGVSPVDPDQPVDEIIKLNILCIGNSHTEDAWAYVPFILKQYGIDCLMVLCLKATSTVYQLLLFWGDTNTSYVGSVFYIDTEDKENPKWSGNLLKDSNSTDSQGNHWCIKDVVNLKYKMSDDSLGMGGNLKVGANSASPSEYENQYIPWDIVSIQPYRNASSANVQGNPNNAAYPLYHNEEDNLIADVNLMFNNITAALLETHAAEYKPYVKALTIEHVEYPDTPSLNFAKNLIKSKVDIDMYVPVGPSIFTMRANSVYRNIPTQYIIRNLYAGDSSHLCEGLPCYTAAATVTESIFRYYSTANLLTDSCNELIPNGTNTGKNGVWNIPWRHPQNNSFVMGVDTDWDVNKAEANRVARQSVSEINTLLSNYTQTNDDSYIDNWTYATDTDRTVKITANGCSVRITSYIDGKSQSVILLNGISSTKSATINVPHYATFQAVLNYELGSGKTRIEESSKIIFKTVVNGETTYDSNNDVVDYYPWHPTATQQQPATLSTDTTSVGIGYYRMCYDAEYTLTAN